MKPRDTWVRRVQAAEKDVVGLIAEWDGATQEDREVEKI